MFDLVIKVAEVLYLGFGVGGFTGDRFSEVIELIGFLRIGDLLMDISPFIDERCAVGGQVVQFMPSAGMTRTLSLIVAPLS